MRASLSQIPNLEDALTTIDNRNREWSKTLSPLGQFLAYAATVLRTGYEFPLGAGMKRYAGSLYAIADEKSILEQLMTERDRLKKQRQVMEKLENEMTALVSNNAKKKEEWQRIIDTTDSDEGSLSSELCEYYADMIEYMNKSSERIVKAMKKVTATAIDSDESLIFNDLEQHSSLVFYMQNRENLRQRIEDAKNERLQMERIQRAVLRDLDFLRNLTPLDNIHLPSNALTRDDGAPPV